MLGDFNQALADLPASAVLERLGWAEGVPASGAAVHPRRIDWTVLNRPARWAGARVRADWGLGAANATEWSSQESPPNWCRPGGSPAPDSAGGHIDLADYWRASSSHDVDDDWDALERATGRATRAGARPAQTRDPGPGLLSTGRGVALANPNDELLLRRNCNVRATTRLLRLLATHAAAPPAGKA